jgi:hypothetical protein
VRTKSSARSAVRVDVQFCRRPELLRTPTRHQHSRGLVNHGEIFILRKKVLIGVYRASLTFQLPAPLTVLFAPFAQSGTLHKLGAGSGGGGQVRGLKGLTNLVGLTSEVPQWADRFMAFKIVPMLL